VVVLVLGIQVLMERLMLTVEHAVKPAMRTARVRLAMERLVRCGEILVTLLVFLAKLFMDLAVLPAVMRENHRSSEEHPSKEQGGKRECFQRSRHMSVLSGSASYSVETPTPALIAREERAQKGGKKGARTQRVGIRIWATAIIRIRIRAIAVVGSASIPIRVAIIRPRAVPIPIIGGAPVMVVIVVWAAIAIAVVAIAAVAIAVPAVP